jgi:DNA-binding winged helix-turn-helix (wHTH) protein
MTTLEYVHSPATLSTPAWLSKGFNFGEWAVNPAEHSIRRDDRLIRLEPRVMQLLLALVAKHDEICSKNELLSKLWPSPDIGESALTRAMCELRKALGDRRRRSHYIDTIQNVGYKAIAPVRPMVDHRSAPPDSQAVPAMSETEELIVTSRYLLVRGNSKDIQLAYDILKRQTKARPDLAQASALLGYTELLMRDYSEEPPALHVRRASERADRALALDRADGVAWAVLGGLAHERWCWSEALDHYSRAYAFQPHDPLVLHGYAELLLDIGRIEQAQKMMRESCRLQPTAAKMRVALGWLLMHGEEQNVLSELSKARHLGAQLEHCDNLECLLLHRAGWDDAGIRRWTELNQLHMGHARWLWPSYFIGGLIDDLAAPSLIQNIRERVLLGHLDPGVAPFMLTLIGDLDGAFELAKTAIEQRRFFTIDPWLEEMRPFRQDPRFADVRRSVGLDGLVPVQRALRAS